MAQFPDEVYEEVCKAAENHGGSIKDAVAEAVARIRAMPDYQNLVDQLVVTAVQELVYRARQHVNQRIKYGAQEGDDAGYATDDVPYTPVNVRPKDVPAPKVKVGQSKALREVYDEVYSYCVAGRTLGDMTRKGLLEAYRDERSLARGHVKNSQLFLQLSEVVQKGKTVRQSVPAERLRGIIDGVFGKIKEPIA